MVVCHLDHGLRGASSKLDARLVKRAADRMGLKIEQARARTADYAQAEKIGRTRCTRFEACLFEECAGLHRCTSILLAHHADDQVETCLFNFLRGSGAAGLGGMKPVSSLGRLKIHRPFLGVTRAEISTYQKPIASPFVRIRRTRRPLTPGTKSAYRFFRLWSPPWDRRFVRRFCEQPIF